MTHFFLLLAFILFAFGETTRGQNNDDQCFELASVPFSNTSQAQDWVDISCECIYKYIACDSPQCITNLWSYMYNQDTEIIVDGHSYGKRNWRAWNTQIQKAHRFTSVVSQTHCQLDSWSANSISMSKSQSLSFSLPVPAFANAFEVTALTSNESKVITFEDDGTFAKLVYSSSGGVAYTCLNYLSGIGSNVAAAVVTNIVVPDSSVFTSFFSETDDGIIVFLGVLLLIMYLALLYAVVRVCSMCIVGVGNSGSKVGGKQNVGGYAAIQNMISTDADHDINKQIDI